MQHPSKELLVKSSARRVQHLMVRTLEKFECAFPHLQQGREGKIFKADLRNMFNDVIRAQRDELNDYDVEYRPLRVDDANTLAMTRTFMQTVKKVEFGMREEPYMKLFGASDRWKVLNAIRYEFGTGVVLTEDEACVLEIVGTQSCVDHVIPIMDKYHLDESVRPRYRTWRAGVVERYRS